MKKFSFFLVAILALTTALFARELKPRIVFEKYLFAEGDDPKARYLDRLMVKFFDEDMVRLRDGQLISLNGRNSLTYTKDFLARHPEIQLEKIISVLTEEEYAAMIERNEQMSGWDLVDLFSFYRFRLPAAPADAKALLADILNAPEVEVAYYECIPYQTLCTDVGQTTPNYRPNQTYHDPAPLGTDLDYAWATFGEETTDGVSTNRTAVIEYQTDFTPTHEDFTSVTIATSNPADTLGYHGTSVAGIVGACEENNVGVVGYTADHAIRYYDITALASVADVYTLVNSQLNAGDYTTGSWAYFASPLPPGQTCPCNPGQNGHVPAEYDPATKTAIQNGVAGGIHYLESAGNGCTNLDHSTFGNTFRWSTDTGAMIVGAVESTGNHDASCFTCYGERVTLNAWGDGIVTTGRGTLFTGNGRREYYNASFGGTSGAGPIVAGCGGVLNNVYRSINGGANIAPTTLRSWLAQGGTQPGTTPGNIGVMPNLFAIMSPNLNPDLRTGWSSYYVIPRNSGDATGDNCLLPATLVSDPDTTFWNSAIENTSNFGTATPANWRLYRDDVHIISASLGSLSPLGRTYHVNTRFVPGTNVRGGRHTVRSTCDALDQVVEFYENDNTAAHQFVWNPRALTAESPLQFTSPPTKTVTAQPGSYYNCDGYILSTNFTGWWDLLGVMSSTTAADYDARVYSESITSTNGFDDYEKWSGQVGPMDFVGRNQNVSNGTVLASVIDWNDDNADYIVEGETTTYLGTPQYGRLNQGSYSISSNELMEAVEFRVDTAGRTYTIEVDVTSGNANLAISIFSPADTFFAAINRDYFANSNGASEDELLCITPNMTGYWLIVVHKYNSNDWGTTADYTLYLGKTGTLFDLTHNLNSGWSHKIVVRQQTGLGTPATLPATLSGNATNNYFNAGYINLGCASSLAGINDRFYIDGQESFTTGSWASHAPGATTQWLDRGPVFVFGGRHQVTDSIDVFNEGAEWLETNNRHDEQFVWTPFGMSNQTVYLTANPAPNWRDVNSTVSFTGWNQDGWRFEGSNRWSGMAMCPTSSQDDYLLNLYAPSTGSQDGFIARLTQSFFSGAGSLRFVVENGNLNGVATFDAGVTNNWAWPNTPSVGPYRTYQCNSLGDLVMNAANGPYTLGLYQLIHVWDLVLTANDTTRIWLDNLGTVDLGLAIFEPNDRYGSRSSNGTVINSTGDAGDELVHFIPIRTGSYGIVVFKNDYSDFASCQYRLHIGAAAPAVPQRLVIQVMDNMTNPIQMRAHWDSVLTDVNGAPLNVDQYQLYYTLDHNLTTFPAGWVPYIITPLATVNFEVSLTADYFRMLVVAIDNDGLILAHSPLPDGSSVVGTRVPVLQPDRAGEIPVLSPSEVTPVRFE